MTMFRRCLAFFVLLLGPLPALADVIIQVQNASLATNGLGFVDVWISSSTPDELLTVANFDFAITGSPNVNGSLDFMPTTDFSPPGYVFGAATGNFSENLASTVSLSGGDFYQTGDTSVTLTGATQTLVRLNLKHNAIGDPSLAVGNTFTISLVNSGLTDFAFWDDQGDADPLNDGLTSLAIEASSFTSFGTITIASAAVPEPGTFAVLAIAGLGYVGRRLRHRRMPDGDDALRGGA